MIMKSVRNLLKCIIIKKTLKYGFVSAKNES